MLKNQTRRLLIWLLFWTGLLTNLPVAYAHGEKALEPFIRTRTIQWFDVQWSEPNVSVNDEVVVTGKFHVAEDWPVSVPKPDASFLNISVPGPVMIRTERYLNGQPWVNSVALQPGADYDFKVVLKARFPGRFHIHPFFNLKDAGPVMGPGQWINIGGNAADFTNRITTLNGDVIDMESYGLVNGAIWHGLWFAIGLGWLLWWVRHPLFLPRYKLMAAGREDILVTNQDRTLAKVILVAVPVIVLSASAITQSRHPNSIPLQTALDRIEPLAQEVNTLVKVKVSKAEYRVSARSMILTAEIRNNSLSPIRIGEFSTAGLRFLNSDIEMPMPKAADPLTINDSLHVSDKTPIAPGETRTLTFDATDANWKNEKLDGLINDSDSRLGGLLFFYGEDGSRLIASISAAVLPRFN
ncbi:MAG TPA: bacterial ammonia monooxygenase, subunit AmoB [Methylobacter sp.]|jgi:methane/ammonia monooxygenase subunit B